MEKSVILVVVMLSYLASIASSQDSGTGLASFVPVSDVPSDCLKDGEHPVHGVFIAAVNTITWKDGEACKHVYSITCQGSQSDFWPCTGDPKRPQSVSVEVVGHCAACDQIDYAMVLSEPAFVAIIHQEAIKAMIEFQMIQ